MNRSASLNQQQTLSIAARPAGGGFALILLLAVVAAVPAATLDHSGTHTTRREAPRDLTSVRAISGSLVRVVRDLVAGGSVVAAATEAIAMMAPEAPETVAPYARLSGQRPHAAPARPELSNIPPPAA
ncbi:MAG: hypothetical protein EA376_08670 [Phycisphaeraceae bacterium]|nr:MAG: hypothetical protein EA376_08670 [Phycisphaeraceae bacterium]